MNAINMKPFTFLAINREFCIRAEPETTNLLNKKENKKMEQKHFLTTKEAAKFLAVCKSTILRLIESGDLQCVKIRRSVRIPVEAMDKFTVSPKTTSSGQGGMQNG